MQKNKDGKYGIGKVFPTNNYGNVEIVEKLNESKRKIVFLDYDEYKIVTTTELYRGNFAPNSIRDKYSVGKIFKNLYGDEFQIIEKLKGVKNKIKFTGYEQVKFVDSNRIKDGTIKNNFKPSICGIGYLGMDSNKGSSANRSIYIIWANMIRRCYGKNRIDITPTYKNIKVCEEWHNYQNFAKWYLENYPKDIEGIKFEIDKDLLQEGVENKIYSPSTCVFLPKSVNVFLFGGNNKDINTGLSWKESNKKWQVSIGGGKDRCYLGIFENKEDARFEYLKARKLRAEKQKDYLRSLNYLSEEIIELVR